MFHVSKCAPNQLMWKQCVEGHRGHTKCCEEMELVLYEHLLQDEED